MSNGDLNINSIDRFRKNSERLILEQHGSCEVPAGCGGVVLRWHNPFEGRPVAFTGALAGRMDLFVNGQAIATRAILPFGENVIALRLTELDSRYPFLFASRLDIPQSAQSEQSDEDLILTEGCSQTDGEWLYSVEPDGDDVWIELEFDDSEWTPLLELNEDYPEENRWRFESVEHRGGRPLKLPQAESICIRRKLIIRGDR